MVCRQNRVGVGQEFGFVRVTIALEDAYDQPFGVGRYHATSQCQSLKIRLRGPADDQFAYARLKYAALKNLYFGAHGEGITGNSAKCDAAKRARGSFGQPHRCHRVGGRQRFAVRAPLDSGQVHQRQDRVARYVALHLGLRSSVENDGALRAPGIGKSVCQPRGNRQYGDQHGDHSGNPDNDYERGDGARRKAAQIHGGDCDYLVKGVDGSSPYRPASASTIFNRRARQAGGKPLASASRTAMPAPQPYTAAGTRNPSRPPVGIRAITSGKAVAAASRPRPAAPKLRISDSMRTNASMVASAYPSAFSTPISGMRSRTDCIMVLS